MKGKIYKKGLAVLLGLTLAANVPLSRPLPFHMLDSYAYTGTATVKASSLNVRSDAGTGYSAVARLAAGASVRITGEKTGTDGKTWYQIQYTGSSGQTGTGYVSSSYIRIPVSYSADANFEAYLTSQGFPESYKDGLRQLHAQYPNWVFRAKNTGIDWNTAVENESVLGRNLVATGSISSWKSVESGAYNWDNSSWTGFDGSNWVAASQDIIRYYMDPRNFLDDTYVFQFLSHEYDGNSQTKEGLTGMVAGSFLSGTTDSTGTGGSSSSSSSSGPGGSSSANSSGSSSGSVSKEGPGGRKNMTDDSNHGPGVSGGSSSASQSTSGGAAVSTQAPGSSSATESSSTGNGNVSLESPHASITPKEHNLVTSNVSLVAPGQSDGSSTDNSTSISQPGNVSSQPGTAANTITGTSDQTGSSVSVSTSKSYVDILMDAAAKSGVSPYVLAAMILQEQGVNGGTPLISGNYSGYSGYYNFFNVEAYQSGSMSATQMGLRYASQSGSYGRPWNTVEKSILGGAQNYGDNYVKAGQNTFYLKKFNVQGSNPYKHQYMSNVQGAASEAERLSKAYSSLKNSALEFYIPVFNNMPEQACAAPTGNGSPNNKLSGLNADGFSLTPSFGKDTLSYNLIVDTSVTSIQISASTADGNASVAGTGNIELTGNSSDIAVTVTAQNGSTRTYTIHVVRQAGGATPSGQNTTASPAGSGSSSSSPGNTGGHGETGNGNTPGGSNVTIVNVQ